MTARVGSLFTGAAGLDMAVNSVYGARTVWHCENDPAAMRVLEHRYPGVPNLGDITEVDWNTVEPVDIICGGSPCQDVSSAGKRAGMRTGTRSGLWASMCDAIDIIRPSLVVWENVRGVLSAEADSGLEPCPGCVGDPDDGAVLRALGRVLADLADVGYDASWCGLRAADVGAPHGRFRVFVVAADAQGVGHERGGIARGRRDGSADGGDTAVDAAVSGLQRGSFRRVQSGVSGEGRSVAADAWGGGWDGRAPVEVGGPVRGTAAARDRPHTPADPDGGRRQGGAQLDGNETQDPADGNPRGQHTDRHPRTDWGVYGPAIQREVRIDGHAAEDRPGEALRDLRDADDPQTVQETTRRSGSVSPSSPLLAGMRELQVGRDEGRESLASPEDESGELRRMRNDRTPPRSPQGPRPHEQRSDEPGDTLRVLPPETALAGGSREENGWSGEGSGDCGCSLWGQYAPAIHRWEMVLRRTAPAPTELAPKGGQRLSARAVEFMMGLPDGWVTGVPGVTRNDQLKILGNGVVPQQAAAALRQLT